MPNRCKIVIFTKLPTAANKATCQINKIHQTQHICQSHKIIILLTT